MVLPAQAKTARSLVNEARTNSAMVSQTRRERRAYDRFAAKPRKTGLVSLLERVYSSGLGGHRTPFPADMLPV